MKIILLGDSITQGLGSKKINFTRELQKLRGEETKITNLALTGKTILYAIDILDKIKERKADLVFFYMVMLMLKSDQIGKDSFSRNFQLGLK